MNTGGSALVSAFDAGVAAFNCTMSALSPGERTKLRDRIKILEKKIKGLYVAIAKETSKYPDPAAALESVSVMAILGNIKDYNNEIELMKQRLAEIDKIMEAQKPQKETAGVANFFVQSISGLLPGEKSTFQQKIFRTADVSNMDTEKSKPVEKKPQPESIGVAKFFLHAITDTMSGYLPGEKSTPVSTATKNENKSADIDTSEPSDTHPIGYTRTKPCLIPTPTPQPPTRDDIETATRGMKTETMQEDQAITMLDEHPVDTVAAPDIAEEPEADTDTFAAAPIAETNLADDVIPLNEFESIRSRSNTKSFDAVLEDPHHLQATVLKPEAIVTNVSGPAFHTRVHQPASTSSSAPAVISAGEMSSTHNEKNDGKKTVAHQKRSDKKRR
jgi:hypothetical protein